MTLRILNSLALSGALLCGCSASHEEPQLPSSEPIEPVTGDAVFVVIGGSAGSIAVIDPATNELAGRIQLEHAEYPHHVYLSEDNTQLLLAIPGVDLSGGHGGEDDGGHGGGGHGGGTPVAHSVLVLDSRDGTTQVARRLAEMNHNAIFSPDGQEVWTSQMSSPGSVLVLDASTLETKTTIPVGDAPAEVTFSPDGSHAFVANTGSDSVSVIDVGSKTVVETIQVGDTPVGAWPGRDGVMYVDNEAGKSLTAIDATTLDVVRTYELGFTPAMAAVPPAREEQLWVTDTDGGRVVIYSVADGTVLDEIATGAGAHAIAFSDDGQTAYVTNQLEAAVSVIDVADPSVVTTIPVGAKPNGIVFRPAL
jgi:YVTN family beta-propeller protein